MMARAITSPELALLRTEGQRSKLFLAIHKPATVYTARVNQATFGDPVVRVTYDGGSGTLADVLVGMTMYVGTSAGAYDKGMVRIREEPTVTEFVIGESSEINWEDDDYLTVVDDFSLWSRHPVIRGTTSEMDYDVDYQDQHTDLDPVVNMGSHHAIWLEEGGIITPDASTSWVLGSTISEYLWVADGASDTSDLDTATPTITYDTAGQYRISCKVTAANGKYTIGYRYVFVFDEDNLPITQFDLKSCSGSYDDGGWQFSVSLYDEVAVGDVRDRSLAILFAIDYYGTTQQSLGAFEGYENIIAVGWITSENLEYSSDFSRVDFDVRGPAYWLQQISGYPVGMEYVDSGSAVWTDMDDLTVDHALWHLLHWRSTATLCMDIYKSGIESLASAMEAPIGNLWQQIETLAYESILARPACDRYGRLFIEIYTSFLVAADRAGVPVVMEMTKNDYEEPFNLERNTIPRTGMIEVSGITFDGTTAQPLFSRAPGIVLSRHGVSTSMDRMLLEDQDHCNQLSGLLYANQNNEYPNLDITLGENNRFIDIVPRQRVTLTIAIADFPRGIAWTTKKFLPLRVTYMFDSKTGIITTQLELEGETGAGVTVNDKPGVTIIPPQPVEENIDDGVDPGDFPIFPPPDINFPPYVPTPPPENPLCLGMGNGAYGLLFSPHNIVTSELEDKRISKAYFPCNIRDTGFFPTRLELYGAFYRWSLVYNSWQLITEGDESGWYTVEAIDSSGGVVASASSIAQQTATLRIITFGVGGNANIWGIRVTIDEGESTGYTVGTELASGSVDGDGTEVTIISDAVVGNYYSIVMSGGPVYFRTGDEEYPGAYYYKANIDFGYGLKETGGYRYDPNPARYTGFVNASSSFSYWYRIGNYTRVFFKAGSSTIKIKFSDTSYDDNEGTMDYTLSEASLDGGYKMDGLQGALYNICPTL